MEAPREGRTMSLLGRFWIWLMDVLGTGEILCDTCRYDHPKACNNPERPNARRCKQYKRR